MFWAPSPWASRENCQVSLLQTLKNRPFPAGILESLGEGRVHDQDEIKGLSECAGFKKESQNQGVEIEEERRNEKKRKEEGGGT